MTSDLAIYRSAKLLIDRCGDEAAIKAAMQADTELANGDLHDAAVWRRIVAVINELHRSEPKPGERRH